MKKIPLNKKFSLGGKPEYSDCFQCFGELSSEEKELFIELGFDIFKSQSFTMIRPKNGYTPFEYSPSFEYLDGFSPNLNKKLHIGHFSNLVLASAFKNMGVAKKTVAIYGDLLDGTDYSNMNYNKFNYSVDSEYLASKFNPKNEQFAHISLESGSPYEKVNSKGKEISYEGCLGIVIDGEFETCIKSNGETSYFYQDVCFADMLGGKTLYLTGYEQEDHFAKLKKLYPHIHHIGLGLVYIEGEKMSSRKGNAEYMDETIAKLLDVFDDIEVAYNVFAGYILGKNPKTNKNIVWDSIQDMKNSHGLYLSYTMARLNNLPIEYNAPFEIDFKLHFHYIQACNTLNPSVLFAALVDYCKKINKFYDEFPSKDFSKEYNNFKGNLELFIGKLGLYVVKNRIVNKNKQQNENQ